MSLRAPELTPLVAWLDGRLRGAGLQGVRMPDPTTLVLTARVPGENIHLLLSWHPKLARLHTVERPPRNPAVPSAFQGLLRKELRGRVEAIEQLDGDRIVRIRVMRGEEPLSLVVELTGRTGNAWLLAGDTLQGSAASSRRPEVVVGGPWTAPTAGGRPGADRFDLPDPAARDAAIREHYAVAAAEEAHASTTGALRKVLSQRRKQLRRLAGKQRAEAERAAEAAGLRAEADLLRGSFHLLRRGLEAVEVTDWSTGQPRVLELDPALTPAEQVDRRFARARKVERAGVEAGQRLERTEGQLSEVEALLELLDDDPEEVRSLLPADLKRRLEPAPKKKRGQAPTRLPYRSWWWRDVEIRVGRGARDNDDLTFHHSRGNDLWLHVRDRPGAHVVVRFREEAPPLDLLLAAGALALKHGGIHDGDRAEVGWTRCKNVRKPKGFPPGKVLVTNERALLVDADPAVREALATEPPA